MINTPDGLPTLSHGAHEPHEGSACFMEYASLLAGLEWSDSPSCTHPVIAATARTVNDRLPDGERHKIAHLIPSVIGTADTREDELERRRLSVRLAAWCARQVVQYVRPQDRDVVADAISAAEAWADEPSVAAAAAANAAAAAANAANAAAAAANAAAAAAYAADAAANAANADAAAIAADDAAYAAAAADARVDLLAGLIAEHQRLTGHTPAPEVRQVWESTNFQQLISAR